MKLIALMKKEFHRFFHDPRLIVTLLLPGVIIYLIYSVLGDVIRDDGKKDFTYDVAVYGESQITGQLEQAIGKDLVFSEAADLEAAKEEVNAGKKTALIVFSENFDDEVAAYVPSAEKKAPQVEIYYRSGDEASYSFYTIATQYLNAYESSLANKFDVNGEAKIYDFTDPDEIPKAMMSGILPFIVVVFIFSACMSITLESVAGEKERGTLATILVTSVKRSHVALGKIVPLSCVAALGAASSFIGVSLSMPKLMGASVGSVIGGFGFLSYLLIFLLILSVVPLITSLISVVSAYSRSVKEASAYTSVIMILIMLISLVTSFVPGIGAWAVAIPVLNSVVCMQNILLFQTSVWQSLVSVGINLVYTALLVFVITKMLSSEKIMYGS
ncbi:MAG: ABC transporter permease [Clostridia bacterium]|jgi:sodium transport system permease protein|nr:ABC transporter permease [Clostridia bacterium]